MQWRHWPSNYEIMDAIDGLHRKFDHLAQHLEIQMSAFDDALKGLTDQAQKNTDAEDAAAVAIGKLADLVQQNANNPQALLDLAAKLKAHADPLAAAIVAGTPAAAPTT